MKRLVIQQSPKMDLIKFFFITCTLFIMIACANNENGLQEDNNLYRIMVGDKYGFMNSQGKIVIEPQFDKACYLSEGLCFVKNGGKTGLIDSTGTIVVHLGEDITWVSGFESGLSEYQSHTSHGIISKDGKTIISGINGTLEKDNNFIYTYHKNEDDEMYMIIGLTSEKAYRIGNKYVDIGRFHEGLCAVKINEKWGYIDYTGKLVIDTLFDRAFGFHENGLASVEKGKESWFINMKGEKVIAAEEIITGFECNRAVVVKNGKKCLIDKTGKIICNLNVDSIICNFSKTDNLATILKDNKAAKIDTMGNIVLSTNYSYIGCFINDLTMVKKRDKGDKVGMIDYYGNEIISISHDNLFFYIGGRIIICDDYDYNYVGNHIYSYYDLQGNLLWKDMPNKKKKRLNSKSTKEDIIEYLDERMEELDPIEGIYYVTERNFYQSRLNPDVNGINRSSSQFFVVLNGKDYYEDDNFDGFVALCIDSMNYSWVNKFVKLGDSNNYAIVKSEKDSKYSSEGMVTLDNPSKFEFRLEQGNNGWGDFYVIYEFVKDYPITTEYEMAQRPEWTGTGFAISEGYIATNYHVANGAKTIRIKGIGGNMEKSYKGYVVAKDKEHDIAIIKIVDKEFESLGSIPYSIGKTNVDAGDDIFVLGYPLTEAMGEEVKVTTGVISATSGFKGDNSMYQISAAVQPGNSGGPVFNEEGAVVGIVCAKLSDAENANYAVKTSYLYSLINSENLGIDITGNTRKKSNKLSKKVQEFKNYVYLIECSRN